MRVRTCVQVRSASPSPDAYTRVQPGGSTWPLCGGLAKRQPQLSDRQDWKGRGRGAQGRGEPGVGLGLPGTVPLEPPQPRAPVAHLAPSRPHRPPRAEGGSVMGGCAGLAGGCAPHILNHRTVVPQRLQRVLSCLLWLSKVKLTNSEGEDFCGGVLILDNFVLTTATCSLLRTNISVKTREYVAIQLDRMAPETKTLLCRNKRKPFNLGFSLLASRW